MAIKLHEAAEVKQNEIRTRSNERDEFQISVDKDVENLKSAWEKARKPAPGLKAPAHRYVVNKDDRAEMKNVIHRAARLHKVQPVFFKDAVTPGGLYQIKLNLTSRPVKTAPVVEAPATEIE